MYHEIGAFDAKAKLSELLRKVEQGEQFTITVRGRPIADLIPSHSAGVKNIRAAIEAMRSFEKVVGLSGEEIANFITEGRE